MTPPHLTLVLDWLAPADGAAPGRLPALETLLARADRRSDVPEALNTRLCELFDVRRVPGGDLPVASLCRLADGGGADDACWLLAEPVHLLADQDKLYLAATGDELEITAEEALQLAGEFNSLFSADGWELQPLTTTRWYLRLPMAPAMHTTAAQAARGHNIRPLLPQGADAMRWHVALNEVQMLFHASPVNAERQRRGLPAINSLWPWGGGYLPQMRDDCRDAVWSDQCLARGLALASGLTPQSLPVDLESVLQQSPTAALVVALQQSPGEWERAWFVPALEALRQGRLGRLTLHLADGEYQCERRHLRRWWRRRHALSFPRWSGQ